MTCEEFLKITTSTSPEQVTRAVRAATERHMFQCQACFAALEAESRANEGKPGMPTEAEIAAMRDRLAPDLLDPEWREVALGEKP